TSCQAQNCAPEPTSTGWPTALRPCGGNDSGAVASGIGIRVHDQWSCWVRLRPARWTPADTPPDTAPCTAFTASALAICASVPPTITLLNPRVIAFGTIGMSLHDVATSGATNPSGPPFTVTLGLPTADDPWSPG